MSVVINSCRSNGFYPNPKSKVVLKSVVVDGEAQQVGGVVAEVDEVGSSEAEAGVEDEEVLQAEEREEDSGVTEEVEVDSVVVGIVVVVALEAHDKILFN